MLCSSDKFRAALGGSWDRASYPSKLHGTQPVYQALTAALLKVISEAKGEIMGTIGRFEGIGKRK